MGEEKTDAAKADAAKKGDEAAPAAAPAAAAAKDDDYLLTDVRAQIALIERSAATKDPKAQNRVLRQATAIRRKLSAKAVAACISSHIPESHPLKAMMLELVATVPERAQAPAADGGMEVDTTPPAPPEKRTAVCAETEAYLALLLTQLLIDNKDYDGAMRLSSAAVGRVQQVNQRTLDGVSAKLWFAFARSYELAGRTAEIRSQLLAAHRTATLHHNTLGQVMLLNLLLRNYLAHKLYDQADKMVAKTGFPENAPNNQLARYLYYLGRIKAVQLEYSEAHGCLLQAQRKAPQRAAAGFRLAVAKLTTVVQLLMGEVPARITFQQPQLERALRPYLHIVQAVRKGDLAHFKQVMEADAATFHADANYTLIVRLRQTVIRAGLRNINLAYTRISLESVSQKLKIDRVEDVEGIVAKAIRDGVIEAEIDHAAGVLISKEVADLYATLEPQAAFHKRTTFCLNVHNDAVKAMSFPPDAHKSDFEEEEAKRKERLREEAELAQSLAEEEDEDF
mmetsp:Transcript_5286/g.14491  ORF Transcript_5286/g.14491 Transcript_5286/m.14491 type:complete len:509 (+) Transcript_5286:81-1607(+)